MDDVFDELRPACSGRSGSHIPLLVLSGVVSLVLGTLLAAMRVGPVAVLRRRGTPLRHRWSATPRC